MFAQSRRHLHEIDLNMITQEKAEDALGRLNETRDHLLSEIRKGVVGQDQVIEELLITLLARGHCLLTGIMIGKDSFGKNNFEMPESGIQKDTIYSRSYAC